MNKVQGEGKVKDIAVVSSVKLANGPETQKSKSRDP